jgi:RimJ/RimL family protein N-acetyltransferase
VSGATGAVATERLQLRPWRDTDRAPFAALNADPEVMKYFASVVSRESSDRSIDLWQSELALRGWSNWAVEIAQRGEFIGFVGLSVPRRAELPFMPCVEIGWRLARAFWGQGYATEAARAALRVGFQRFQLPEIVSFTSVLNRPSRAVMERIGMLDAGEDFDHPALPEGSELRRHCLYRITLHQWGALAAPPARPPLATRP